MTEKKPPFLKQVKDQFLAGVDEPAQEAPKKFCLYCEKETATWGFCDQCGRFFWGRIGWDLACGGICTALSAKVLLQPQSQFYEKALAVLVGIGGLWVLYRISRQLWLAYLFRKARSTR